MKFKDYLIIPIIAMYIVFTSSAYINSCLGEEKNVIAPEASVSPEEINLGDDVWYAEGSRANDCFCGEEVSRISIDDMHMLCATDEGKKYDLIFVNSMTAYDCNSGLYYERADYNTLIAELESGKFVNVKNYEDYYVFKESGKSTEYFGDKVYKGEWVFDTSDTLLVYDRTCKGYISFKVLYDAYGDIEGISNDNFVYNLVT